MDNFNKVLIIFILIISYLYYGELQENKAEATRREIASERIKRDSVDLVSLRARIATLHDSIDSISDRIGVTFQAYDTLRRLIVVHDTIPMYNVPLAFIVAADSVKKECDRLRTTCNDFRITSALTIENITRQRDDYKNLYETYKCDSKYSLAIKTTPISLIIGGVSGYLLGSR